MSLLIDYFKVIAGKNLLGKVLNSRFLFYFGDD